MNNFTFLTADSSRLTALRKLEISTYFCTFAPCQVGASIPKKVTLFIYRPLISFGVAQKRLTCKQHTGFTLLYTMKQWLEAVVGSYSLEAMCNSIGFWHQFQV